MLSADNMKTEALVNPENWEKGQDSARRENPGWTRGFQWVGGVSGETLWGKEARQLVFLIAGASVLSMDSVAAPGAPEINCVAGF